MKSLENRIPPPIVMSAFGLAMAGLSKLSLGHPTLAHHALGSTVALAGLSLAGLGVREFQKSQTTINPIEIETASTLVTTGVFGCTRNPMYFGFTLMLVGLAIVLAQPLTLLGPIVFALYINAFQIAPEERAMEQRFGEAYVVYTQKVRRW